MKGLLATLTMLLVVGAAGAEEGEEWTALLDGDSIAEWTVEGKSKASFTYEGGIVTGQPVGNNPENSFLCSPREYRDFELAFSFRITPASLNSGVQFRSHVREDGVVAGPQLEMEVENPADIPFLRAWVYPVLVRLTTHPWRPRYWASAGVYGEALDTGWIYPGVAGGDAEAFAAEGEKLTRPEGWNEVKLDARGPQVRTWLAGAPRADFRYEPIDQAGRICLQVHGGAYEDPSQYQIEWKDLRIREH